MTLARTEFKLRYFGSVLGYVWSLMRPLLFFGVLYVFFVKIVHIGKGPYYGAYLLTAIVLWNFLARGDRQLRHLPGVARGDAAQDPLPADGDPALGVARRRRSTSA